MTITKRVAKPTTAESFISAAPDAAGPRGVRKGNRLQITLTLPPALLARVDKLAEQMCQSRASVINSAILHAVERGVNHDRLRDK